MTHARSARIPLGLLALLLFTACADCGQGTDGGPGDGGFDGSTGETDGGGFDGGALTDGGEADAGVDAGTVTAEVCDGEDNDRNGIIDDVDAAKDGVCDCLRIATVGYAGAWGTGDVFSGWLDGKSLVGAVPLGDQVLTPERLAQFDVVVVQDVRQGGGDAGVGRGLGRAFTSEEIAAVQAWVAGGGGLMTLIGYDVPSEIANVNTLLAPLGMAYGSQAIHPKNGGATIPITGWAEHPLADNVTQVGVDNGYPVTGGTLIAWEPQPGAHDLGRATTLGEGHVFVWGDEWITYDSEWQAAGSYQVERLWLNALKWLTPVDRCQVKLPEII